MSPKEDQAEKHRRTVYDQAGQHGRAALAKMDSTETPEQRTFSIRVRTIDGCKQASIVLSLDDNITEIRERIQDELELRQISTIWVVWSNFKPGIERSRLTERNLEETLRGLWRSKSSCIPIYFYLYLP